VVEVGAVDEEFTRAASVLAEEVGVAGFLSLNSEIAAGAGVIVDVLEEGTTLLADVVETGVAAAEGVDVGPLEVAVEVAVEIAEMVEVGTTSEALVAEVLDLVMVKVVS